MPVALVAFAGKRFPAARLFRSELCERLHDAPCWNDAERRGDDRRDRERAADPRESVAERVEASDHGDLDRQQQADEHAKNPVHDARRSRNAELPGPRQHLEQQRSVEEDEDIA